MGNLREQIFRRDTSAVTKTIHTLKGSSWQIGGFALGNLIEETEVSLSHQGLEAVCEAFPQIDAAFDLLRREIKDAMDKAANNREAR
jgi:hypothetical protein